MDTLPPWVSIPVIRGQTQHTTVKSDPDSVNWVKDAALKSTPPNSSAFKMQSEWYVHDKCV